MQQSITIRHTSREWSVILEYLSTNRIDSIQSFINTRLYKAVKSAQDFEYCACDKSKKTYLIPPDICAELEEISRQRCIPLAAIVQRNFIDPILLEDAKRNGILL